MYCNQGSALKVVDSTVTVKVGTWDFTFNLLHCPQTISTVTSGTQSGEITFSYQRLNLCVTQGEWFKMQCLLPQLF